MIVAYHAERPGGAKVAKENMVAAMAGDMNVQRGGCDRQHSNVVRKVHAAAMIGVPSITGSASVRRVADDPSKSALWPPQRGRGRLDDPREVRLAS